MKLEEKIITWSSGKKTAKFISQGGDILKHIGSEVLMVQFHKDDKGVWTTDEPIPVTIVFAGEFEPLTGTYRIIYKEKDSGDKELRITPEGFSWNVPEEDGWMTRFVPYSVHFKMMEEEIFYNNLRTKFNENKRILGPDILSQFSTGKERKRRLVELNYITAVINTDIEGGLNEGILAFRISEITNVTKRGKKWSLVIKDMEGDSVLIQNYIEDPETKVWYSPGLTINNKLIGDLKILDIES